MKPVQPVTNTEWFRYQKRKYSYPYASQTETVTCTFEEALAKALKERELIEANDKSFNWKAR